METACVPIEPSPNVMMHASELRSATPTDPGRPKVPASRVISTPDAIMLATCAYARDAYGIEDIILHSTDEGKHPNWAGKCIPIIGFEKWYPKGARSEPIEAVCSLNRSKPIHPEPHLTGIVIRGKFDAKPGS